MSECDHGNKPLECIACHVDRITELEADRNKLLDENEELEAVKEAAKVAVHADLHSKGNAYFEDCMIRLAETIAAADAAIGE